MPLTVSRPVVVKEVRIGLLGCGGVGQAIVQATHTSAARLAEAGIDLECVVALVRDRDRPRAVSSIPLTTDHHDWRRHQCDVVVEVLGGIEPARTLVAGVLSSGIPVVTANKSLIAAHGVELQALAASHGTSLYFEASVLAGVPCVNTLARRPLASGGGAWAGIVNGTSHFILSEMARGRSFEDALVEAVARGYAEASSDADISGRDAAEKLTILLHLAGHTDVVVADLPRRGIGDLESWHLSLAHRLGGVIKPVALADTGVSPGAWVGPAFVPHSHPFAHARGVTNILSVGRGDSAVWFSGPGAGPAVTAATVIDDVVEAASACGARALAATEAAAPVAGQLRRPQTGAWFLALDGVPSTVGEVAEFLASNHLPAVSVSGEGPRIGVVTAPAAHAVLLSAIDAIEATGVSAVWWPVLEVAHG
ncbi:MAG TPA: homoserine dehydrogenase [Vicinamibacterales bacterium]|nr:homoserine dehydrogenase [Vicinamibacterales bacterium]